MELKPDERLLSPVALGELLDVPVATIYKWRTVGKGPRGRRLGKHVRYRVADVEAWLEESAEQTT